MIPKICTARFGKNDKKIATKTTNKDKKAEQISLISDTENANEIAQASQN